MFKPCISYVYIHNIYVGMYIHIYTHTNIYIYIERERYKCACARVWVYRVVFRFWANGLYHGSHIPSCIRGSLHIAQTCDRRQTQLRNAIRESYCRRFAACKAGGKTKGHWERARMTYYTWHLVHDWCIKHRWTIQRRRMDIAICLVF
jgi:hypothetical protein